MISGYEEGAGLKGWTALDKAALALVNFGLAMVGGPAVCLMVILLLAGLSLTLGKYPVGRYLKLWLLPGLFLLTSLLGILLDITLVPRVSLSLSGDWQRAGEIAVRALACLSALFFLLLNSSSRELLALAQASRLPKTLVTLLVFTHRCIYLVTDSAQTALSAQRCRGAYRGRRRLRNLADLFAALWTNSFHRLTTMNRALAVKQYQGVFRTDQTCGRLTDHSLRILAWEAALALAIIFLGGQFCK